MEKISEAIYKALRDDSETTNGLRTLLGNTATNPFNVYHAFLPDGIDFSPSAGLKGFVTYQFVSGVPEPGISSEDNRLLEEVYSINAYHRTLTQLEKIHRRIKWRLQNARSVTNPTSESQLYLIRLDNMGPIRFDEAFNVYWQLAQYRAWLRDDDLR